MPASQEEANRLAHDAGKDLERLPHGTEWLGKRKRLAELRAFYRNAAKMHAGTSYLTQEEVRNRRAPLTVSHIAFGRVHLLNFPGELFSTVARGLEQETGEPTVVVSFADGVTGYLLPQEDLVQGGYESTWAPFTPESIWGLRATAVELVQRVSEAAGGP
jgi:hypothetical protein